jgi:LysR family nitrogen assimilation transcriptional regulator
MDLKALRYFEYVAELKSFTKAALHLRVEQPALSRQMRKLEKELGVALVRRHGRGIELTDAGTLLLQRAKKLSHEVCSIAEDVRSRGDEMYGTISIGTPPTIGDLLMPPLLIESSSKFPHLRLEIVESASPDLSQFLLNGELSLAILHNPEPHRDLVIVPMVRDLLYLVGPGHEINGLKPVLAGQPLTGLPMILPRAPHNRRLIIDRFCLAHDIELNVRHQVNGFTIIRAMVEHGLGYSILSHYGVQESLAAGRLSATQVSYPEMPWELCFAYRCDVRAIKAVKAIIAIIGRRLKAHVQEGIWWPNAKYLADRF